MLDLIRMIMIFSELEACYEEIKAKYDNKQ